MTLRLLISLALCLFTPLFLFAQEATETDDEVIEMSPFLVDSSRDVGYVATNTLAGSRLNTELFRTPASISVFTPEFLEDAGLEDTNEIIEYAVNFDVDTSSNNGNSYQGQDLNVRARGFRPGGANGQSSRNFFNWYIRSDSYSAERFSFARGPNSILFGLGEPGGIINVVPKRARFTNFTSLDLKYDEWGTIRATADVNYEAIKDLFAVRVNLLYEDEKTWRDLEYEKQSGAHLALTYKPWEGGTIRLDGEVGERDRLRFRRWAFRDRYSNWFAAGRPDYVPNLEASNPTPEGVALIDDDPVLGFMNTTESWMNFQGLATTTGTVNHSTDFDIVPKDSGLAGPAATSDNRYYTYTAILEQRLFENLFLEFAYNVQDEERVQNQNLDHNAVAIRYDPNVTLVDGSPNPNYQRTFLYGRARRIPNEREVENLRFTASYDLDLTEQNRWLGRHRFAALLANEVVEEGFKRQNLANRTPLAGFGNRVNDNFLHHWDYVDYSDGNYPVDVPKYSTFNPYGGLPAPFAFTDPLRPEITGTITADWVSDRDRPQRAETDSWMLAGQSFFWEDRIALTYGYREDTLTQAGWEEVRAGNADVGGPNNILRNEIIETGLGPEAEFSGDTTTYGVVVAPIEMIAVSANFSENFKPQSNFNIFGDNIGNVSGEGEDYSMRVNLLGRRLYAVVTYYETILANTADAGGFNEITIMNDLWSAVDGVESERIDAGNVRVTTDLASEGWEFEIVGNPTPNLSILANFSLTEVGVNQVNKFMEAYIRQNRSQWEALDPNTPIPGNEGETVGSRLEDLDNSIAQDNLQEGRNEEGSLEERGNLFVNYKFTNGAMDGWDAGLGIRYRGTNNLGYWNDNGTVREVRGDSRTLVDLKIGYETEWTIMNKPVDVSFQLNIKNVLDEDDIIWTESNNQGVPEDYVMQDPRRAEFRVAFDF